MLRDRSAIMQNGGVDWNDLRYFLAVAQSGSTLAAGRLLGVSQTTAARRIAALEAALGLTLFERRQAGYRLTPAGEGLLDRARTVDQAAEAFTDAAAAHNREVSGTVRLTADDIFAVTVLPVILGRLHDSYPGIRIELDSSSEMRDLAAGAADVALRRSKSLVGSGLVGRRIVNDVWRTYCSRDYAAAHGRPTSRSALRSHTLIGGGGEHVSQMYSAWLKENDLESAVALNYTSITGLLAAIRAGVGVAVLPCFVADLDEDLVACLPSAGHYGGSLWLVTHERLRNTPRVRVVVDFLAEHLTKLAKQGAKRAAAAA
jgi:DNA-binding transcriptional LysR family regulator